MMTLAGNDPNRTDRPLDASRLALLFERFLEYWCGEKVRVEKADSLAWRPESLEWIVRWSGRARGALAVKFEPSFYPWLVQNRDFRRLNLYTEAEVLKEITGLYCLYVIQHFSLTDLLEAGPLLPRLATADNRPLRGPEGHALLKVEDHSVEVSLWREA